MSFFQWIIGLIVACSLFHPPNVRGHGDLHEQTEELTSRIDAEGPTAELLLARAGRYRLHGDFVRALADLEQAAQLDPHLPFLDRIRGGFLLEAGRPDQAAKAVNRFLNTHPNDAEALLLRARALTRLGATDAAAQDYDRAISHMRRPPPDLFLERAQTLLAHQDPSLDRVLQGLDQGIQQLGPIPSLQHRAIELELSRTNYPAALARLHSLVRYPPGTPDLLLRKGDILRQAGQPNASQQAYHQALQQIETLPPSRRAAPAVQSLRHLIQQRITPSDSPCIK